MNTPNDTTSAKHDTPVYTVPSGILVKYGTMATQAQLDEKLRQDRLGAQEPLLETLATPAQLAEKARKDEAGASAHAGIGMATPAQLAEKGRRNGPPPLPPRASSVYAPPPYTSDDAKRSELISEQWRSNDPRSSSTHSLVPQESERDGRRTLLLVFIHGFMGNETSFQSFPAHVHNLLAITLAETHVVHTKIYPRYKSRKAIEFARDDFSDWLEPHENRSTDVVLLGHSMGGILSAEVALQRPPTPATGKPFRHRLLGTINFDTPFLGMHPGVVVSGIGSLFRPAPDPPGPRQRSIGGSESSLMNSQTSASSPSYGNSRAESQGSSQISLVQSITSPVATPSPSDPFFNPPFPNDVRLPERKGWTNLLHFVNKHSDGLTSATKQYVMSHLEFGGCMADYPGLKNRYEKIRALEDVADGSGGDGLGYRSPGSRVRFVNYYTASTGRPKAPKPIEILPDQVVDTDGGLKTVEVEMQDISLQPTGSSSQTPTPRISVEEHRDGALTPHKLVDAPKPSPIEARMQELGENSGVQDDVQESQSPPEMQHIDSMPIEDDEYFPEQVPELAASPIEAPAEKVAEGTYPVIQNIQSEPALPPIPPMPTEPEAINLDMYTDKDSRKIAEKEYKRVMKVYTQAVKDRESAIKDRKKLVEKREKKAKQERDKQMKAEEKQRLKEEKEEEKRKTSIDPEPPQERHASTASSSVDDKPKRDKKFCMLPPETGGKRDKCWIRVYMDGVDEVGAHCGLFFPGPQYESLVGDVGERVSKWVEEDATRRAILEAQG